MKLLLRHRFPRLRSSAEADDEVTGTSAAPLDEEAVRAAVDEAGYELVGQV